MGQVALTDAWRLAAGALIGVTVSATPVASHEGFLEANGARIDFEVEGRGAPLVLIHGWSLNLRMWDRQVPDLPNEFQVIRQRQSGGHEGPSGRTVASSSGMPIEYPCGTRVAAGPAEGLMAMWAEFVDLNSCGSGTLPCPADCWPLVRSWCVAARRAS